MNNAIRWPLKIAIYQKGMTQRTFAQAIGKDPAWVSRVVQGVIDPSDADCERIQTVLEMNPNELKPMVAEVAA